MFDIIDKINYYWHVHRGRLSYLAFFIAGILFVPFLFNLFLYFTRKRKTEHLLFSIICLLVIIDTTVTQLINLSDRLSTYIDFKYFISLSTTLLFSTLLPLFLLYVFSLPKKTAFAIVGINLLVFLLFTDMTNLSGRMSVMVLVISGIITLRALILRREDSAVILTGLAISWAAYLFRFEFAGIAAIMVICTSFLTARQFARKEKAEKEAQFRAITLENQLLKKNINPHFLLNTLTSVIVWMRRDPKSAIQLVEALAEEFRILMRVSPLQKIPMKDEINLCRLHLKIMNYRKGADFQLSAIDLIEEENIPPMIFHTLLENGLTHGYENNPNGTFILERKKTSDSIQYIFSNDGDFTDEEPKDSSGFGMQYIKSRLEESYPGRWELFSRQRPIGWETIITVRNK